MKLILHKIPLKISLTGDSWTSPVNQSVPGVTAHWIDEFELKSMILAVNFMDFSCTGVNLVSHLTKVLQIFGISQSIFCITDNNASNNTIMTAKLKKLAEFDKKNCMLVCLPHVINLAAKFGI